MKILFTSPVLFRVLLAATVLFPAASKSQQVIVGTGTAISVFSPLNRTNDYCVYEVIYLASDINMAGDITHLAFQRVDGTDTALIENVDLYMLHTPQSQLFAGTFDTAGYTHLYSGTFPNDAGSGWREVTLTTPFLYNGTDNLQVLAVKGYQPAVANTPVTPRWYYTNISPAPARARRYFGDTAISSTTNLATTQYTSNVRLTLSITTGAVEIISGALHSFPNPAINELTVNGFSFSGNGELTIYNTLGEKILSKEIAAGEKEINLNVKNLAAGIYVVKVNGGKLHWAGKFVKE
ncbi:MAG TPA: T9SS type A sorting domain-containing protein [Bacteroidia bacterium]|nr:T9SS type A sorting domain-containing protein [Bacteroidia bacterium]